MLPRTLLAPALLLAWQVAPVGLVEDDAGRLRLAFGGTLGAYEERTFNCSGEVEARQRVTHRTVGGQIDYTTRGGTFRVIGAAGRTEATLGQGQVVSDGFEGWHGAAIGMVEQEKFGVGFGVGVQPDEGLTGPSGTAYKSQVWPMIRLRLGPRDGIQSRFELGGPLHAGAPPDRMRLTVGSGWEQDRRFQWQFHIQQAAYPSTDPSVRYGAMVAAPLPGGVGVGLAWNTDEAGSNTGLFLRYSTGGKRVRRE